MSEIGVIKHGQQAVTASAQPLSGTSYGTIAIKALSTNSISVFVGGPGVTTANGFELTKDQVPLLVEVNTGTLFVVASGTGASVTWILVR